jgi:hypothetical protein
MTGKTSRSQNRLDLAGIVDRLIRRLADLCPSQASQDESKDAAASDHFDSSPDGSIVLSS